MLLKKTLFSAFMAAGILLSVSALEVQADPLETGTEAMQETQESAQAANAGDLTESGRKNYAVASVSEGSYVNVRENAGTEYPVVGKLENHGLCYIQKQSGKWYRVVSGEVEGYIKAEYVLTGTDALQQASTLLKKVAKVTTDGLKVRTEPNTECEILDMVGSGQSFDVLEELDGNVFMLVERGCIVNLEHIDRINARQVILSNGSALTISKEHIQEVRERLGMYCANQAADRQG